MKLNKQKIDEAKEKIMNIKRKLASSKDTKVPKKYYALLILMLMLGVITLSNNVRQYNESNKEDYIEYELEDKPTDSTSVEMQNYMTAESSISTTVSNIEEEAAVETISNNNTNNKTDNTEYIMPVEGKVIKEFAIEKLVYSETLGMWKTHPGIDINAELGCEVKSASNGTVQEVTEDSFYGNVVKILDDKGYTFVYSNLDDNIAVNKGDRINKGVKIGEVGVSATGELADESHLHFEVIKDQTQINPLDLIN